MKRNTGKFAIERRIGLNVWTVWYLYAVVGWLFSFFIFYFPFVLEQINFRKFTLNHNSIPTVSTLFNMPLPMALTVISYCAMITLHRYYHHHSTVRFVCMSEFRFFFRSGSLHSSCHQIGLCRFSSHSFAFVVQTIQYVSKMHYIMMAPLIKMFSFVEMWYFFSWVNFQA